VALDRQIRSSLDAGEVWAKETWALTQDMRNTLGYKHLGFDEFELYMADRTAQFNHVKASRGQLVLDYTQMGYSQREIAEKLGISQKTVSREAQHQLSQNDSIDVPNRVQRKNGGSYPRERKQSEPDVPQPDPQARLRDRTGWCSDDDGWKEGYQRLTERLGVMLRNPTALQLEQLEGCLVRSLQKVRKMKEQIAKQGAA
jgi:transcriptional regulator with XRE-family HTH domain